MPDFGQLAAKFAQYFSYALSVTHELSASGGSAKSHTRTGRWGKRG
jgi:hypothetical protein